MMNVLYKTSTAVLFVFLGLSARAQTPIDGVWSDCNSEAFSNCKAVFAQVGDSIFMTHYIEWNGQPFVEYGEGVRNGDTLSYHVWVTLQIPGWSTEGDHVLTLSPDGQSLKGTYSDNKGNKGPLNFFKVLPSQP